MVAGEAQLKSWVSNRKFTLGPNWILSPEGMVRSLLSSSTEFRDSIHSGSMSPSQIIQDWISIWKSQDYSYSANIRLENYMHIQIVKITYMYFPY